MSQDKVFNPATGWPESPTGFVPPAGWEPNLEWPPAPAGWPLLMPGQDGLFNRPIWKDWLAYWWALNSAAWVSASIEGYSSSPSTFGLVAMSIDAAVALGGAFVVMTLPVCLVRRAVRRRRRASKRGQQATLQPAPATSAPEVRSRSVSDAAYTVVPPSAERSSHSVVGRFRARVSRRKWWLGAVGAVLTLSFVSSGVHGTSAAAETRALCQGGSAYLNENPAPTATSDIDLVAFWMRLTAYSLQDILDDHTGADGQIRAEMSVFISELERGAAYLAKGDIAAYRSAWLSLGNDANRLTSRCV